MRRPPRSPLFPYTTLFGSADGGQIVFRDVISGAEQDTLQVSLRADGTPADFFVAGKPGHPSVEDKDRSEEHTSELQSRQYLVCRLLLEKNTTTPLRSPHPP